jgi:putative ABC transport system permease protein
MIWIAFQMLTGDRAKYFGILVGISFATLLIAQQSSIFCGLLLTASSQIYDAKDAPIWVMDPGMQFVDDIKPLSENELLRVRGVSGVAWAARFYKGLGRARFSDGKFQQMMILGLDDAYMVGAPREIVVGSLDDLRQPDAVIMDERGYRYLWPGEPYILGRTFEMNDRRAVLVGICKASRTFQTFPIIYTRFSQALRFAPQERKALSFILAAPKPGLDAKELCERITKQTRLKALTREEFAWVTIWYYLRRTGIPINFGTTVLLGFFVGTAIAGQTFYLFTIENLRQFGGVEGYGSNQSASYRDGSVPGTFCRHGWLRVRHRSGGGIWLTRRTFRSALVLYALAGISGDCGCGITDRGAFEYFQPAQSARIRTRAGFPCLGS